MSKNPIWKPLLKSTVIWCHTDSYEGQPCHHKWGHIAAWYHQWGLWLVLFVCLFVCLGRCPPAYPSLTHTEQSRSTLLLGAEPLFSACWRPVALQEFPNEGPLRPTRPRLCAAPALQQPGAEALTGQLRATELPNSPLWESAQPKHRNWVLL